MGSFDVTCVVSNIGISSGDAVFAVLIAGTRHDHRRESNWEVISPLLPGQYTDYGNIALDEDPPAFMMEWLKENLMPLDAGENSFHEPRFDPATLDWDILMGLSNHARLFLQPDTWYEDSVTKHHTPPLIKILEDAGYDTTGQFSKGGIHVFPVKPGSNLHIIELPFEDRAEHAEKIRDLLSEHYSVMIAAASDSYGEGIIVAPKPAKETADQPLFLGSTKDPGRPVRVVFVRQDLLDVLIPEDDSLTPLVEKVRASAKYWQRKGNASPRDFLESCRAKGMGEDEVAEMEQALAWARGCRTGSVLCLGEAARQTAADMVLNIPIDEVSWFTRWARASKLWLMLRHHQRKGLRPVVQCVGSQCAAEDWNDQLGYHLACVKVLRDAIKARDEERAEWVEEGGEWWTGSGLLERVEASD